MIPPILEVQADPSGNLLVDTSVTVAHGKVFKA
jgi:hypothetical protein